MKNLVQVLEKIGQTQSMNQVGTINAIKSMLKSENLAFEKLLKNSFDQVCIQFPDDDDDDK